MALVRYIGCGILALLISVIVILPVFGLAAMDWGKPSEVKWRNEKNHDEGTVIKYPNSIDENVVRVCRLIRYPYQPDYWRLVSLCAIFGIVATCLILRLVSNEELKRLAITGGLVQVFLIVACLVAFFVSSAIYESMQWLKLIPDEKLSRAAMDNVFGYMVLVSWLWPLGMFVAFDLMVALGGIGLRDWLNFLNRWAERKIIAELNGRSIVIGEDRQTRLMRLGWEVKWYPWPVAVLKREQLSLTTLQAFLNQLALEAKKFVAGIFLEGLPAATLKSFRNVDAGITKGFLSAWSKHFLRWAQINADDVKAKVGTEGLLNLAALKTAEGLRQEISFQASSAAQKIFSENWSRLLGEIRPSLQTQTGTSMNTPVLPEGAKFFAGRGARCVFVIEQKPQLRQILFSGGFVGEYGGLNLLERATKERFNLAFPYTVFVVALDHGNFAGLSFFFRSKPLASLEDEIFQPCLPNIHGGGAVCLGDRPDSNGGDVARMAEAVIAAFWGSQFNADLRSGCLEVMERNKLRSLKDWENRSVRENWLEFALSFSSPSCGRLNHTVQRYFSDVEGMALVDIEQKFEKLALSTMQETGSAVSELVSESIKQVDLAKFANRASAAALKAEINRLGLALAEHILLNAEAAFASEDIEGSSERLRGAVLAQLAESISKEAGSRICEFEFSHQLNIWDTMERLVPQREEEWNS